MAKNSSAGGANRKSPSMRYNKPFTPKGNTYPQNGSKTNNFMSGKTFSKPFKNK